VSVTLLAPPDEIIVTANTNMGLPQYTLTVIDVATGMEQDQMLPMFFPARPEILTGAPPVTWTLTANSSGEVQFFLSVNGEVECGPGCFEFVTRTAISEIVTIVLR
jgi:hypothetical protein